MTERNSVEWNASRRMRARHETDFDRDESDVLLALRDLTTLVRRLDRIDMHRTGCVGHPAVSASLLAVETALKHLNKASKELSDYANAEGAAADDARLSRFFTDHPEVNPE